MTVQEFMAQQIERIVESYCQFIDSTLPEKLDWKPEVAGSAPMRTILEQVHECIHVNHAVASLFRNEVYVRVEEIPAVTSSADAKQRLYASGRDLADTIRALSDEDLDGSYQHPRAVMSGWNLTIMPLRNMMYHCGQLNLFQMLYGDGEFHAPTNWR